MEHVLITSELKEAIHRMDENKEAVFKKVTHCLTYMSECMSAIRDIQDNHMRQRIAILCRDESLKRVNKDKRLPEDVKILCRSSIVSMFRKTMKETGCH